MNPLLVQPNLTEVSPALQLALEVAPCQPFSNILDTVEIITCSFIVDSMVMTH